MSVFLQPWNLCRASGQAMSLYVENDTRKIGGPGSDSAYSNGFKLSYIASNNNIPEWMKKLISPSKYLKNQLYKSQSNFAISLAQQIFTPRNINNPNLIENDRPYAAWSYLGLTTQFANKNYSHAFELDLGLIGPSALGEVVQNNFHRSINQETAKGWKNQLRDEMTIQFSYHKRLKIINSLESSRYYDFIPYYGGSLGNVAIDIMGGMMFRLGLDLPFDFGPTRPSAGDGDNFVSSESLANLNRKKSWNSYFFISGHGTFVGRNIFLDGNTSLKSHRVEKKVFVIDNEFGLANQFDEFGFVWRFVTRSPEFKEQKGLNSFASLSLTYLF